MKKSESTSKSKPRKNFLTWPRYQVQFALLFVVLQINVGILYQGILQMRFRRLAEDAGSLHGLLATDLWRANLPWMLGLSLAVALIGFVAALFVSNSIVGPIPRIQAALRRIAVGDFTARLRFRPGDALEDLADDVNHVAESLGRREPATESAPEEIPEPIIGEV